jgi:hypothetical protein
MATVLLLHASQLEERFLISLINYHPFITHSLTHSPIMKATSRGGIYFFAGLGAATSYLGVWQAQRYGWKKELIRENTEKFEQPVQEIKRASPDM